MRPTLVSLWLLAQLHCSSCNLAPRTILRRQASEATATSSGPHVTAVSECSLIGTVQHCTAGFTYEISVTAGATNLPDHYTGCHNHGPETYCIADNGDEVHLVPTGDSEAGAASTTASPVASSASQASNTISAISECHLHDGSAVYCMGGTTEFHVATTITATSDVPPQYTGCHQHGETMFCIDPTGEEVEADVAGEEPPPGQQHCHFHAGVEHCVGGGESGEEGKKNCDKVDREYNIPLRIGLIFVILATSAIGVFSPILIAKYVTPHNIAFTLLKQFGTGVIISTAFVHLATHSNLMFGNSCLGEIAFEGTSSAIMMAGIFLSFVVEYGGNRFIVWHSKKRDAVVGSTETMAEGLTHGGNTVVNITVLEAGIIFHSLIIGVTLVVAGDSFFLTLFAVIVFHQMFEGIALGSRIAAVGHPAHPDHIQQHEDSGLSETRSESKTPLPSPISRPKKLLFASAYALVTPIGMAIGVGVIHHFNGNDPATVIALGTLDALSAGILVWVGVYEMLGHDWMMPGGDMVSASPLTATLGVAALVAGMALMSFLGKWA